MENKAKIEKTGFCAACVFLLCYFMMLFDFPNKLTILFGSIICLVLLVKQKKFRLDSGICLLTLTLASYFIILNGVPRAFTMSLPYVGLVIYVLAHYLSCEVIARRDGEKKFIVLILVMVAGVTIHGLLNSYLFLDGQFQYPYTVRIWADIWKHDYVPGTWQVVYFLPVLAIAFPMLIYWKKNKIVNTLMLLSALFFVYISMASESRTSVVIFAAVFCVQLLLYVLVERNKVAQMFKSRKVWVATGVVAVLLIIAGIVVIKSPLGQSFLSIMGRNGGILNNIRFQIQRRGLEQLFEYPWGGYQMNFLGYAHSHNTWIDIADAAGVIPFFSFAAYTLLTIYEMIRWLLKKEISTERKLIVAGIYGAFFLYYTVERGLGGSMHFMTPWFFLNGMVHGELSMMKRDLYTLNKE